MAIENHDNCSVMCGCGYIMDSDECIGWHAQYEWSRKAPATVLSVEDWNR